MSSYQEPEEEPLLRIAARRAIRRAKKEAETPEFGRLLSFQASGAAGDALIALALAGSLFFSVPEADARDKVALYLGLTVAPFAIAAPFLSLILDRGRGSMRVVLVTSALTRGALAWLLASRLDTGFLYPIAFGILLMSRAGVVVRGAILPTVVPEGRPLVAANASMSKTAALAGIVVVPLGVVLIQWPGPGTELVLASLVFFAGAIPAIRLPRARGSRNALERSDARAEGARAIHIRQAVVATVGMRMLVGFLVFHLAFALRREDVDSLNLGLLLGAGALGSLLGALVAPPLRKRVHEEGIIVVSLALASVVALIVGRWFSVPSAAILVLVFATTSGAAKLAFDSIVQRDMPEGARGWAFARFESLIQLAWVVGGVIPLLISIPAGPGVVGVGVAAGVLAGLFAFSRFRVGTKRLE